MTRQQSWKRLVLRVSQFAPFAALAALLAMPLLLPTQNVVPAEVAARRSEIAEAVQRVPWRFGAWVAKDAAVPAPAIHILRPNALLSRQYFDLTTNRAATLVVVHCSDVRDMQGHYPPFCYPNAGWNLESASSASITERIGSVEQARVQCYRFVRLGEWNAQFRLTVMNFFILPDGSIATDLSQLGTHASRTGLSMLGVVQVQVVIPGVPSDEERRLVFRDLMEGLDDLFRVLIPERKNDNV